VFEFRPVFILTRAYVAPMHAVEPVTLLLLVLSEHVGAAAKKRRIRARAAARAVVLSDESCTVAAPLELSRGRSGEPEPSAR
jgi:hypothetical protein